MNYMEILQPRRLNFPGSKALGFSTHLEYNVSHIPCIIKYYLHPMLTGDYFVSRERSNFYMNKSRTTSTLFAKCLIMVVIVYFYCKRNSLTYTRSIPPSWSTGVPTQRFRIRVPLEVSPKIIFLIVLCNVKLIKQFSMRLHFSYS